MLKKRSAQQIKYGFICIEDLVPKDHLLRKILGHIDSGFIHEKVQDLYCPDNGRPALDPVVLFKMLFLGYLYGIRSERRLVGEIKVNGAYRWLLGLGLDAGYSTAVCKGLVDRDIFGVIGHRRFGKADERLSKRDYVSEPSVCRKCSLLGKCTGSKNCPKLITRHIWEASRERINANRRSERGKAPSLALAALPQAQATWPRAATALVATLRRFKASPFSSGGFFACKACA